MRLRSIIVAPRSRGAVPPYLHVRVSCIRRPILIKGAYPRFRPIEMGLTGILKLFAAFMIADTSSTLFGWTTADAILSSRG